MIKKTHALYASIFLMLSFLWSTPSFATAPNAGGDTTVVNPNTDGAVSITEDAVQPESANIRLIVPTLTDPEGGTPDSVRIISVTGGTLWQSNGSDITLGASGTVLSLTTGKVNLRFRPTAGRDTNASFVYVVVDPSDSAVNSSSSTATIPITAVNDEPVLQTTSGSTGLGLAATYYLNSWDLTGSVLRRIDATVDFKNNFGVDGMNNNNFSARWTGQIKAPLTGDVVFSTVSDDGVRLWIDDTLIIDNWTLHGDTVNTASPVTFESSTMHTVKMEFYERGGGETAKLRWSYTGQSTQIIPQANLFPAIARPTLSYVTGSGAVVVDDGVTVSDVDSSSIGGGSVTISSNYQSDQDELVFTNQNGITGSFSEGTLTLTGTTTLSNYQTALRSVRYRNTSEDPNTSTRVVEFLVNDGAANSNSTFRNISFTGINTAPVITEGASTSVTMDQNGSPTAFSLTLNATDAENQSIVWSVTSTASHGTASATGSGDSVTVNYTPTVDYAGTDSFVVQASDGMSIDTITVNVTIREQVPPVITSISATSTASSTATVTWTTDENASSKVLYGLSSASIATAEADTETRVTSHSKALSSLLGCTTYYYAVVSRDQFLNSSTSTQRTFTTAGCQGNATQQNVTSTPITVASGGSTSLTEENSTLEVSLPANVTNDSDSLVIQVHALRGTTALSGLGLPQSSSQAVGPIVFDAKAIINNTTILDSFDASVTINYTYAEADVSGLNESTLTLYHYHNGAWRELDDCTVDTSSNRISCTSDGFSIFALFGQALSTGNSGGAPVAPSVPVITDSQGALIQGGLALNDGASHTESTQVKLSIAARNATQMAVSEDPNFVNASFEPFRLTTFFTLSQSPGKKTVYVKLRSGDGGILIISDSIILDTVSTEKISTLPPKNALDCQAKLYLTKPVRLGYKNNLADVKLLEQFLNTYEAAALPVDGVYSQTDFEAVVRWQEKYAKDILIPWGIKRGTGYVYTTSLAKIKEIHQGQCKISQATSPSNVSNSKNFKPACLNTSVTLHMGMNNAAVKTAQEALSRASYISFAPTGYFDSQTRAAVLTFQADHGIATLGIIGPETRQALNTITACQ